MKSSLSSPPCCIHEGKKTRTRWTPEEDEILWKYINEHGKGCWPTVAMNLGLSRCCKSCRRRWVEHLRPGVRRGNFTSDEEVIIIQLHHVEGKGWSEIAQYLPGRSDNAIKNHWNTHLSKKLKSLGKDPITHQPLNQPDSSAHHDRANLDRSQAAEMVDLDNLDPNIWNHCIEHYPMGCGAESCHNFLCFQQK